MNIRNITHIITFVLTTTILVACSSGSDSTSVELSPEAKIGQQLTVENGCVACHGSNGEGRSGPALAGLIGSQVTLDDGYVVTVDEHYIYKSIFEPSAMRREGVVGTMPKLNLSEEEIISIIAYISELKG